MTLGKKIGLGVLALVLLVLVAMVIIIATFDWNRLKPTINQRVSETIHRPFAIQGELDVSWHRGEESGWRSWVPWPNLHAEDIRVGSPAEVTNADLASLDTLDVVLSPLPLLSQTVSLPRIALSGGEATLARLQNGNNNWTFELGEDEANDSDETGATSSSWTVDVGDIAFDPIRVHYQDETLAANVDATLELLEETIAFSELAAEGGASQETTTDEEVVDFAFGWSVEGNYQGQFFDGGGRLGGLAALRQRNALYPVQAKLNAGATTVSVNGTLRDPLAPKAIDMDLSFSGQNLGDLYDIIGVALPDTPPYSTDGHMTAYLDTQEAISFHYQDFNGQIGDSDIHGTLVYEMGEPRPSLTGEVASQQLHFADLAPLIGADSNADKAERGETSQQPDDRILPVEEFDTEQWQTMDADVRFTAQRIEHGESLPLEDLYTHVRLDSGEILLDPLRFGVAGGNLNTTLRLDGSQNPMQSRVDLHIRRLRLSQLFPDVEIMQNSRGELNGDATLSGSGNSVASILGSSDGELQMLINDGLISQNLMELAGLNVGNYLVGELFGDEQVSINCVAANLNVEDGLAQTQFFVIDTENALIRIDGEVNFANEGLDLTITPQSKGPRVVTLRAPLYVEGTFSSPSPGVDASSLIARGAAGVVLGTVAAPAAALLALVSPGDDETTPCNDFLSQVQTHG